MFIKANEIRNYIKTERHLSEICNTENKDFIIQIRLMFGLIKSK